MSTALNSQPKNRDLKPCIHHAVMLCLMLFIQFIPPIGEITPMGMQVLGIFAGVIYGWSTIGMIVPSILGILGFGLLPGSNMVAVLAVGFGDRVTLVLFFFLIFSALVDQVGLSSYIANWCISRKFVIGKPWGIAMMFCVATIVISATVNVFASMILMWGIFYRFCDTAGFKQGDKFPAIVLIGIIYCASMSGGLFPFMGGSLLQVAQQASFVDIPIDVFKYTLIQLILVLISFSLFFVIAKFIFKPDVSILLNAKKTQDSSPKKMTKNQQLVAGLMLLLMLILFLPSFFPNEWSIIALLKSLDIAAVAMLVIALYYLFKMGQDDAIPFKKLMADINWDLIFMFATVAPLAKAFTNPDSGIMAFLNSSLSDFFVGLSPIVFIALILIIASTITQFANNVAIIMIFSPIMYSFGLDLGVNPLVLTAIAAFALNTALATPAASGPAAMIFSNRAWISTKLAYTFGLIIFVINIVVSIIGIPIAEFLL